MNKLIGLLILVIVSSCTQNDKGDKLIKKYYSDEEIAELESLSDFVINEVSMNCDGETEDCLNQYFSKFKNFGAADSVDLKISQDVQKKLLASLDKSLFEDTWTFCEGQRSISKDSLLNTRQLCIKHDGRFAHLLVELTDNNERLKIYGDPYKAVGDYTPAMNTLVLKQPDRFDFKSKDEFLLVAIHLLTLNYPEERLGHVPNNSYE